MQTKKKSSEKLKAKPTTPKAKASSLAVKSRSVKKGIAKKNTTQVKLPPEFTMKQVKEIVALIRVAGTFSTFGYKTDEFEIEISVGGSVVPAPNVPTLTPIQVAKPVLQNAELASSKPMPVISAGQRLIVSPMIGTFYRRPSPSSPPFVEVGDLVAPDTDVCIVEVMKLLNTIPAECSGRVAKILVEDGASIDVDQPLMVIELA